MKTRRAELKEGDSFYDDLPHTVAMGKKIARVLRTLRRDVIRAVMKKGRYPWAPACLGGLNYPRKNAKGVRDFPYWLRRDLYQLTHSDLNVVELSKLMARLDGEKRPDSSSMELDFVSTMVADTEIQESMIPDIDERVGEGAFVDLYTLSRHYGGIKSNFFRSMGGNYEDQTS